MSKNFVQPGNTITAIAPTGGVISGQGVIVARFFGVAAYSALAGSEFELTLEGVFDLPKAAGAITFGEPLYWDATAGNVTASGTGNRLIGAATVAAASGDPTVRVRLDGIAVA